MGVGIVKIEGDKAYELSNLRRTYVPPIGEGFLPRETAAHHRECVIKLVRESLEASKVRISDIDCVCFTKGACHCGLCKGRQFVY